MGDADPEPDGLVQSEAQALVAIENRAYKHGPDSVTPISLVQVDDTDEDGVMVTLTTGAELLARAAADAHSRQQHRPR